MPRISWFDNNPSQLESLGKKAAKSDEDWRNFVLWCRGSKIVKSEGKLCERVNKSTMRAYNFTPHWLEIFGIPEIASSCFARPPQARHPRVCVQLVVSCDASGFW